MNALSLAATEVHYVLIAAGRFAAAKVRSWPVAAVAGTARSVSYSA